MMIAMLFVAGTVGGVVNAMAGGATLITFPAMLAAGLSPVAASASSAVAVSPAHLMAAIADGGKLSARDPAFARMAAMAATGGALGALLALSISARLFMLPIPAFIALATLLFGFSHRLQRRSAGRDGGTRPPQGGLLALIAAASVYGGFFGAGLGILLSAVLAIVEPGDLRRVKARKNLLATAVSAAAIGIFVLGGAVRWTETLWMLAGSIVGGYAGGHLVRVLSPAAVRWGVVAVGTLMSAWYARQYWFS